MTEEIKYYKEKEYPLKWIPAEEMEETPQQTIARLEQENESLYEEKNCLHKIIDRLLENAGYSKDIASAEDFEDVYEDMQIKQNELNDYRSALEEIRNDLREVCKEECDYTKSKFCGDCDCRYGQILNKINEVLNESK